MSWLLFRMGLKNSNDLLRGSLFIMDNEQSSKSFTVTSGLQRYQDVGDQSLRGRGPIPACKKIGISCYSVRTTPFDESGVSGVEGNFYYVEPDPVDVDGVQRGEFGIHFDANVPGSAGCVVFEKIDEWVSFQNFMKDYKQKRFGTIALIVEYNSPKPPPPPKQFFTAITPQSGERKEINTSIAFSGTAEPEVSKIIATIGPGGPFKIGEQKPNNGQWSFNQTLVTPGVRFLKFRALDDDGDLLQTIEFQIILS